MDNLKNKNKEGTEFEDLKEGGAEVQEQFRVVINCEAHGALMALVERVNFAFEAGKITKSDLVNWMLTQSTKFVSDSDVKVLRNLHFDEMKILESMLKSADDRRDLPDEIKKALRDYYGLNEGSKKRPSNSSQKVSADQALAL
jgi:hypothetical protein